MAADIARTVTEDLTAVATAGAALERDLNNVRAHLARCVADPSAGNTAGLRRVAAVLAGGAATLAAHASEAHHRALAQSSSVS
jgi:hypothetical protein